MVRGSGLRVTGLTARGELPDPILYATSKSVTSVNINEVSESGSSEMLRTEDTDEPRLRIITPTQTIRYTADINFLRVDPGLISLVSRVPVVTNALGDIVGFDSDTRLPAAAFGMELWSRITGQPCDPSGARLWGYTVFPFLKGGVLSGFTFQNGRVSFSLRGAQTRRGVGWGVGPHDLTGVGERLLEPVSRNTGWRTFLSTIQPPAQQDGIQTLVEDEIDGGTASFTTADILDGGFAPTVTTPTVDGGSAA
jgi:hypothetical protein